MTLLFRDLCLIAVLATWFVGVAVHADLLGTVTIEDARHYGYYGFASTSAQNTKATVGPLSGIARTIHVEGTITKVHPSAWASSIRVLPSGTALAGTQPWFQFSKIRDFSGTIPVSATIYAPGGFDLSQPLLFEMYSIDAEQFVPGLDAMSTLTYSFDSSFPTGTVEYSGRLDAGDPTFNRPIQFETNPPGFTPPFLSNRFPYYDVQPFHVSSAGGYTVASANEYESAGVLYENEFDPSNPLANVVRALGQTANVLRNSAFNDLPFADDATGGTVISENLTPGVQYFYVTTAYAAPGSEPDGGPFIGNYHNIITGVGDVTLGVIPEMEPFWMSLIAFSSLAGARSRRS